MDKYSRRSFLKKSVATAGIAATSAIALPNAAKAENNQELATLLDIEKCIGCGECVEACAAANQDKYPEPVKPFPKMYPAKVPVVDWSEKRDVRDRLTPYNWLYIQEVSVSHNNEEFDLTFPRRCMHCINPPCADLCPFGAARKMKNGITRIHPDICLGGAKCKVVCPWHIPERQTGVGLYLKLMPAFAGNGVMYKCDRCYNLIAKGELPACIEACPEDVQTIGPRKEIIEKAHKLAAEKNGYIYGEKENGGTNTLYVSPVPFDKIQQAILQNREQQNRKKGKSGQGKKGMGRGMKGGRPGFEKVPDMMARSDYLGKALLLAPVAGALASFLAFMKKGK